MSASTPAACPGRDPRPRPRACHFCRSGHAPYGFTLPGLRRQLPAEKRDKYLWTCAACRPRGEAKLAAIQAAPAPAARPSPETPPPAPATAAQAQLL